MSDPEVGIGLCLSGGGYRAMLFHTGVLWRLNELGFLAKIQRVSSVSGGSITAALLGLKWRRLGFNEGIAAKYYDEVVVPIRELGRQSIDTMSVVTGILTPGSISEKIADKYERFLFQGMSLQDLPTTPRFVINATNVQSGVLWRFTKPYMGDYRVGRIHNPTVKLALAVAASSAFPPLLSPLVMEVDPNSFLPNSGDDLQYQPFTSKVFLTDGGVYDNLGLEPVWGRYKTILASDAGGGFAAEPQPRSDWVSHSYRILNVIDHQVRSLRKRWLIEAFKAGTSQDGTYWGIRTNIADYGLNDHLPCAFENTIKLANIATCLDHLDDQVQEKLINWGYAVCDAAMRRHVVLGAPPPNDFPYPNSRV